ncbi:MAG: di-trans,poly-cis-decaprenylcistransferase [Clostridia bacterium]|nr:di-trans,poly-cis-decaprenylcistransferase [Clostridia bacterium]
MINHVSIILDGNGRWAEENELSRNEGYIYGAKKVVELIKDFIDLPINTISLFVLSTENYNREVNNVSFIESTVFDFLDKIIFNLTNELNINVDFIGNLSVLNKEYKKIIDKFFNREKFNSNKNIIFAINYSGIDDTIRAIDKLLKNKLPIMKENLFLSLDTKKYDNPDIVIRYGKQKRISNFMLLQIAYSELFFLDKFWPEYSKNDINLVLFEYKNRNRTFGLIKK